MSTPARQQARWMPMASRGLLVGLIVVATTAFVVGVGLERSAGDVHHTEASGVAPAESGESDTAQGGEGAGAHAKEGASGEESHPPDEGSTGEGPAGARREGPAK